MDWLVVLLIALVPGVAAGVFAWKTIRDDRQRRAARVEALRRAAVVGPTETSVETAEPRGGVPVASDADHGTDSGTNLGRLFGESAAAAGAGPGRALVFAGLVVAALAVGAATWSGAPPSPEALSPPPLELLSLRHERGDSGTRITGLVRNPAGAPARQDVEVTALFFDEAGTFLESARGRLEFDPLGSGEESPFVVTAPALSEAARYRLSFRLAGVGGIPHVDLRASGGPKAPGAETSR